MHSRPPPPKPSSQPRPTPLSHHLEHRLRLLTFRKTRHRDIPHLLPLQHQSLPTHHHASISLSPVPNLYPLSLVDAKQFRHLEHHSSTALLHPHISLIWASSQELVPHPISQVTWAEMFSFVNIPISSTEAEPEKYMRLCTTQLESLWKPEGHQELRPRQPAQILALLKAPPPPRG